MECAICYCDMTTARTLTCGHSFCGACLKNWYLKGVSGAGQTCPMCRRAIYFKGFHKLREDWAEDAWETQISEVFGQAIDECFELAVEFAAEVGHKKEIMAGVINDIKDLDRTFRFLKHLGADAEEMEYALMDTDDYFSDRHINKLIFDDEPAKDFFTKYPWVI